MLNLNNAQMVADNTITINGVDIAKLTDTDTQKLLDIIHGMTNTSTPTRTQTSTKSTKATTKKAKAFAKATDFTVPYEVRKVDKGYVLGFSDRVPRDAYTVIANAMGETKWDKELKGFAFKTQKSANEFAKAHAVITSDERETVRATWHKES